MIGALIIGGVLTAAGTAACCIIDMKKAEKKRQAKAEKERKRRLKRESLAREIAFQNQQRNEEMIRAKAKQIAKTMTQKKKIDFFDSYRELDIKTARLASQGSGGITLLINAIRHNRLNGNTGFRLNDLVNARDRRNAFAHHKEKWSNQPDPSNREIEVIKAASRFVSNHQDSVSRAVYKEYIIRSKNQNKRYRN